MDLCMDLYLLTSEVWQQTFNSKLRIEMPFTQGKDSAVYWGRMAYPIEAHRIGS